MLSWKQSGSSALPPPGQAPAPLPPHLPFPTTRGFPGPAPGKGEERPRPRPRKFSDPPPPSSCHSTLKARSPPNSKRKKSSRQSPVPASRLSWGRRAGTNPRKSSPPFTSSPHKKQPNSEQKKTSLGCFIVTMYPGIIFKQLRKHPLPPAPGRKGSLDQGPLLGPRGLPSRTGVGDPPARPLPTPRKGLGAGQSSQRRAAEPPPPPRLPL